ncbi:MAG: cytochrome P450 [Anaerolineae bacterium]|nr:cytochrome P450 [Anaerolineae bacterium]
MALRLPPGPEGAPLVGAFPEFRRDQLAFLLRMAREYGDITYTRLAHLRIYQLNHPDYIQEVLVTQAANFPKSKLDSSIFNRLFGQGLIGINGEFHREQRKLMQPAFHSKRIEAYAQIMAHYSQQVLDSWADGQTLNIHEAMNTLTLLIVSRALYDVDLSASTNGLGDTVHDLNEMGNGFFRQGFLTPPWLPIPFNARLNRTIRAIDDVLLPIIEERRRTSEDRGDLLSMLLLAQDEETGGAMTDQQVRDEVITLFVAGHETTSNALTWTWYLLAQHPEVEAKLHDEVDRVLGGRMPTLDDMPNLPYTDYVLKEAMRLYPPAWILNGRQASADAEIGGYTIPKGATVWVSPYVMHRDPRYFDAPEAFRPERWADGLEKRLPRYAYFPFGGGPRICIGNSFALMEARLILAGLAGHYRLSLVPGQSVAVEPLITLRPRDALMMRLARRSPARVTAGQPSQVQT